MPLKKNSDKFNRLLADKYGSRRGALLAFKFRFLSLFGRYHKYQQVDWASVEQLVFVCKGNICRSAYAEAVAKSVGIEAISCGIDTVRGAPANQRAAEVASQRGFDLQQHKTTTVQSLTINKSDLLIAMEPWQADYLLKRLPAGTVCTLLGLWGRPVTPHIHDPYGASSTYFDNCFNYIENCVHKVAEKVSET